MQFLVLCDRICIGDFMRVRNVKNKENIITNSKYVVLSPYENIGKWNKVFNNSNPIYLEIGMGKGKFLRENARRYPDINFIGIEKCDSILAKCLLSFDDDIDNLLIIRLNAMDIDKVFSEEISRIYLNFSDPWPKKRHHLRRLSSRIFLDKYDKIFCNGQKEICMKTDNCDLFTYSLESFSNHGYYLHDISLDLHNSDCEDIISTEYEDKFSSMNMPIYYVRVDNKCIK